MDNMIIVGNDCESCIYCGNIDESSKAKIVVNCLAREKSYIWGQCIPCEERKLKYKCGEKNDYRF